MSSKAYFPTLIYSQRLANSKEIHRLNSAILRETQDLLENDGAGQSWSEDHYRNGYTSYASVNDLHERSATFKRLENLLQGHLKKFCRDLRFDLGRVPLTMSSCWVNVMPTNAHHGLHLHPLSVVSGTYYVQVPRGSSAICFEDPRLDRMMNTPPRKQRFLLERQPKEGEVLLFESWLRHEVPVNRTLDPRISVSFNYEWGKV